MTDPPFESYIISELIFAQGFQKVLALYLVCEQIQDRQFE